MLFYTIINRTQINEKPLLQMLEEIKVNLIMVHVMDMKQLVCILGFLI